MRLEDVTRILCVITGDFLCSGVEAYLEQVYKHLHSHRAQVDLSVHGRIVDEERAERFRRYGVRFVECDVDPSRRARRRIVIRGHLDRLMRTGGYDVVHVNSGWPWLQATALKVAKAHGVDARIAHSHNDNSVTEGKRFYRRVLNARYRKEISDSATACIACSRAAGEFMYGGKAWARRGIVAPNGIDTRAFQPQGAREEARQEGGVGRDELVVGNVGRLSEQKNHQLILRVFAELRKQRNGARLWLVGDGEDRIGVESLADELGVGESVTFWGSRPDVPRLLAGMDVFLLPSLWEGLPIAVLEAQAAGLPCVCSDAVTDEVDIPGARITHVPLGSPVGDWVGAILNCEGWRDKDGPARVAAAGYDSGDTAEAIWSLYGVRK